MLHAPKKGEGTRITMLATDCIFPNPDRPRRYFDPEALRELSDSIRIHGILQPLTVRQTGGGHYELMAGERRLRAAVLCGLSKVPCLVTEEGFSLLEAIQRRSLDFREEARALERIIELWGLSQKEMAEKVGKSQSAVANKLRLLKLPDSVLNLLQKNGGTERHARALLRLPDGASQQTGAELTVKHRWTVQQTEQYVDKVLQTQTKPSPPPEKEIRLFWEALEQSLSEIHLTGVEVQCRRKENGILLTIQIPMPENGANPDTG